jgi:DsbC/DsbD-like thiol-disulfide interchange protein
MSGANYGSRGLEEIDVVRQPLTYVVAAISLMAIDRVLVPSDAWAESAPLSSSWVEGHNARARIVAGGHPAGSPAGTIAAGIEIEIAEGWKTYWRNPGSSGVPPNFDWTPSGNLAKAVALYPAPKRFTDRDGDTIGYKTSVMLPITVSPADPSRAVTLALDIEYGVCKDICIPVQSRLELTLPRDASSKPISGALAQAFDRVPRSETTRRPTDPRLRNSTVALTGEKPSIRLEAEFPGGADGGDIFLEAPDGLWIPMAQPAGAPQGEIATFLVDLTDGADVGDLKGKTVRVTLVSPRGQSETTLKIE